MALGGHSGRRPGCQLLTLIEALVAKQQHLGNVNEMDSTDHDRLRIHVEELIYRWQEANIRPSLSNPDTALNRLIAEREEIEQQIVNCKCDEAALLPGAPARALIWPVP
jgi:hypothetical protein